MFCNKCGNEVNEGAKFCPKCGTEFQTVRKKTPKQAKTKKGIIVTCIGILVLIIGGIGIFKGFFSILDFESGTGIEIDGVTYFRFSENAAKVGGCKVNVEKVAIPSEIKVAWKTYQVSVIGARAFQQCESLTSVEIPNSVTKIGESAFDNCYSLTSVEIPNSVTEIGEKAFRQCQSLTSIEIPNGVTKIRRYTFIGCYSLTSVEIPNSVTEIEEGAFSGCDSLTSVEIPNSVTKIGKGAFAGCDSLTSLKIPASVTEMEDDIFSYDKIFVPFTPNNAETNTGEYTRSDFVSEQAYENYLYWGDTSGLK